MKDLMVYLSILGTHNFSKLNIDIPLLSSIVPNIVNANIRNSELIASLCYMSDKSAEEVKNICQRLPYDLADIQAHYRMYGEFPE